jgi:hypothetical protein
MQRMSLMAACHVQQLPGATSKFHCIACIVNINIFEDAFVELLFGKANLKLLVAWYVEGESISDMSGLHVLCAVPCITSHS